LAAAGPARAAGPGRPLPPEAALAEARARAEALDLSREPAWLRLGHWERRAPGHGFRSQVDGREFFLAPGGRSDPAAELSATLAGLFDAGPRAEELDDAQCRFPARLAWLAGRLGLGPGQLPRRPCPKQEDFLRRVRARGVTLVFSSYYLNNPSSAFGHTLLRLDQAQEEGGAGRHELLDYGVDYAATVDTRNAVLYAVKGLFGGFRGAFKAYAYYYKVREYGDAESRDLWEYALDLSPEEVERLAAHVWELGGASLRYWYLDRNCSYEVLAALEAAAPRLELRRHVAGPVVLPSDTVKALFRNPGLVREVHYRPSIRTQFRARARLLPPEDDPRVERLAADPAAPIPADLPPERRAGMLDAALDLFDMRHGKAVIMGTDAAAARLRQDLLLRRAAVGVPSPPLELPVPEELRPDRGHGSARVGLGGGAVRGAGPAALLDLRLALHDLLDPPRGYPPTMQIEFLPVRLRYLPEAGRLELDDASLVRIVSLTPVDRFEARPSWRARLGATAVRDGGCRRCTAFVVEGGGGLAAAGLLGVLDLLATADLEVLAAPGLAGAGGSGWRPGLGPTGLARLRLGDRLAALAEARWRWLPASRPGSTHQLTGALRVGITPATALSLEARAAPRDHSLSALVLVYL
jgi:hypothetical protein